MASRDLARPPNAATRRSTPSRRAGFEELNADWGPASPFGPDDDPGTPMTHRDSSESDELDPDLFAPQDGKEPLDEAGNFWEWVVRPGGD